MTKFEVKYIANNTFAFVTPKGKRAFEVKYPSYRPLNYNGTLIEETSINKTIEESDQFEKFSAEENESRKEYEAYMSEMYKKSEQRVEAIKAKRQAEVATRNAEIDRIADIIRERVARGHNKTASCWMMGTAVPHVEATFGVDRGIAYAAVKKAECEIK